MTGHQADEWESHYYFVEGNSVHWAVEVDVVAAIVAVEVGGESGKVVGSS